MSAPKGNQYWTYRNKHGRDYKYTPEGIWEEALQYFVWVEDNPLQEEKVFHAAGLITRANVPHMRAMTEGAFCLFADITHTTWDKYKKNKDFVAVVTRIAKIIYSQKFEGAAAEFLNPNIIARDLGLRDKSETELTGKIENVQIFIPDNGRNKTNKIPGGATD